MSEKKTIKAIIIDDSSQARKLLRLMLLDISRDVKVMGEAENVDNGLLLIAREDPDVVFLDIEMPGKTGLQLAELLIDRKFKGSIVFTTAYNEYAIKAFRLSAIDYLLKPIQEDHLEEAVNKLMERKNNHDNQLQLKAFSMNLQEEQGKALCVPFQGGFEYIPLKEIEYIKADGSYAQLVMVNKKQKIVSKNLKYFDEILESQSKFIRAHRSFLVNMDEVLYYNKSNGGNLELRSGEVIPVARERKQFVQDYLNK